MIKKYLYEILYVVLAIFAVFSALSLFSYNGEDPSYSNIIFSRHGTQVENFFGMSGAYLSDILGTVFGWSVLMLPFLAIGVLVQLVKLCRDRTTSIRLIGSTIAFLCFLLSLSVFSGLLGGNDLYFDNKPNGGLFGVAGATVIQGVVGHAGGLILSVIAIILSILGIIKMSLSSIFDKIYLHFTDPNRHKNEDKTDKKFFLLQWVDGIKGQIQSYREQRVVEKTNLMDSERAATIVRIKEDIEQDVELSTGDETELNIDIDEEPPVVIVTTSMAEMKAAPLIITPTKPTAASTPPPPLIVPPFKKVEPEPPLVENIVEQDFVMPEGELFTVSKLEELLAEHEQAMLSKTPPAVANPTIPLVADYPRNLPAAERVVNDVRYDSYSLSFDLLDPATTDIIEPDPEELRSKADMLLNKLRDFGVDGRVREIRPGPVVTMFELEPAPGIKINKIANLENDLALAMSAISIRIIAPIPGKAAVGIEIPNPVRAMVSLRELLESKEFTKDDSPLAVALGKDISGKPYFSDLRKMPHLLVAGTTGSGKSVCVNTIICSILYKASPDMVKFVMIDPKMVELSVYEGIPHLAAPVVTDPRKASAVLQNVVKEMEGRYALLASCRVRSIDSYNTFIQTNTDHTDSNGNSLPFMPYMVVIVDEFADLMMVAGKEVENSIIRIAQMARAVGIHLVLATQRPSVNVITGIIKANMPARISFRVSSKIDSRTIIDQNGAEILLGRGDSLFLPPGSSDPLRIHGCFVSEAEVLRIVDELKQFGEPNYDMSLLEDKTATEGDFDDEDIDSRYDEAVAIAREKGFASISMIQRYLRIGYNRAARIVEMMQNQGMIAPSDGTSKPREFLGK